MRARGLSVPRCACGAELPLARAAKGPKDPAADPKIGAGCHTPWQPGLWPCCKRQAPPPGVLPVGSQQNFSPALILAFSASPASSTPSTWGRTRCGAGDHPWVAEAPSAAPSPAAAQEDNARPGGAEQEAVSPWVSPWVSPRVSPCHLCALAASGPCSTPAMGRRGTGTGAEGTSPWAAAARLGLGEQSQGYSEATEPRPKPPQRQ